MKRFLSVLMMLCLILSLTACGGGTDPSGSEQNTNPTGIVTGRDAIDVIGEDGIDWNHMSMDELYEMAKKEMGDSLKVRVTCAHLEIQDDADLDRFGKLGVFANFTPWWHAGDPSISASWLGEERSKKEFRCKTLWDSGATVAWSSDNIVFGDFMTWNPYLGMEIGMTRKSTEKTTVPEFARVPQVCPPENERMTIEEMLLGYTINGAKQLGIEAAKGSIEAGKDADFLVFDNDLLTAEQEGFSHNKPSQVYFGGKKVK